MYFNKFEKCVKYPNEMTDDVMTDECQTVTLNAVLHQVYKQSYLGQFAAQTIEIW